ncbi:hypothetical protein M433DRAFT_47995, partial [Acidomyces richmondensis BFW]
MGDLHEALKWLSPLHWNDVPTNALPQFLTDTFNASELLVNSVPPPPNGEPFHNCKPHFTKPNAASTAKEMHASAARSLPPIDEHVALQQCWGKPIKFNPKDNPHHVAMYKMAARDRHGAWFARRSVHEGIGFSKFRRAMQQEFPESLRVEGGAGAGAVRGIAADRRLERIDVEGLGVLEVYQVSAAFPGPVTPRDFITMFITTETGLTEKCVGGLQRGKKHIPRHFMIVSRPVEHPDAPERPGYVRGTYESVEIIREIPLHQAQPRDLHHASASDRDMASPGLDPELNPVEWTMITRSDPGGGLPRFLVERGTPDAMMGDVDKFLRWACRYEEVPHPAEE